MVTERCDSDRGSSLLNSNKNLVQTLDGYMSRTTGLRRHCDRCLETRRWDASVVLMVVDAAFTSIGLNYFTAVVPRVLKFEKELLATGKVRALKVISALGLDEMQSIWTNRRSWQVANEVASYLHKLAVTEKLDERAALRHWATGACLETWRADPIGRINGVGITTFQYLRMMGGIDTAMPDKIVRRVVRQVLDESKVDMPTEKDLELVDTIDRMAAVSGYRPVEICWMTWLIQPEGKVLRMEKYRRLLDRI